MTRLIEENTMESQPINGEEILAEAEVYKSKLAELQNEKTQLERQLIILEEQLNPYKTQIESAFGTTDHQELLKIAAEYLKNIKELEDRI